jgi:hypothetical protein
MLDLFQFGIALNFGREVIDAVRGPGDREDLRAAPPRYSRRVPKVFAAAVRAADAALERPSPSGPRRWPESGRGRAARGGRHCWNGRGRRLAATTGTAPRRAGSMVSRPPRTGSPPCNRLRAACRAGVRHASRSPGPGGHSVGRPRRGWARGAAEGTRPTPPKKRGGRSHPRDLEEGGAEGEYGR